MVRFETIDGGSKIINPTDTKSEIVRFYQDANIFVTGGTGFIGRLVIEKLLRTCTDVNRIYVLVRTKKGKDEQKRFEEIFDGPVFERIKRKMPEVLKKVHVIPGDLVQPNLGISDENYQLILNEVNIIFHCAATVRFHEKIRVATNINVRSTRDVMLMAKKMKYLKAIIHVSTAYSFCTRKNIDEDIYDAPLEADKLIALTEMLDDKRLEQMTKAILGDYPNTYVFTKAIAENMVHQEADNVPVAIVRPSIITASVAEPIPGWIDNMYGATGILIGAATGVLRALHVINDNRADIVPADYVVNTILAAAWEIANVKKSTGNIEDQSHSTDNKMLIFNCVSGPEAPINWRTYMRLSEKHAPNYPSELCVWHYWFVLREQKWSYNLSKFFYEIVPAYIVDFLAICIGKQPLMVKGYKKIHAFGDVLEYFTLREWDYTNRNAQLLWKKLNNTDKELFPFSMKNFDWNIYFATYCFGARCYTLKDPPDTMDKGRVKYYKLMLAHYTLLSILGFAFFKLLMWIFGLIF